MGKVLWQSQLLHLGVTTTATGDRVRLDTGAVAWLDYPVGTEPFPGVVFFHGNNWQGSKQSSVIVIRRTLLEAGFVVLAVDHPGYGQSPHPETAAEIAAWNLYPTELEATQLLDNLGVTSLFIFGHSMGVGGALRILRSDTKVSGAVLFGGSLFNPESRDNFETWWADRFHNKRRLKDRIPTEKVMKIFNNFYHINRIVTTLDPNHAPIIFARFEHEFANIVATRDKLYDAIPGRKTIWDIQGATHYFSSKRVGNLVLGDTRVTRLLADRFSNLAYHFVNPN